MQVFFMHWMPWPYFPEDFRNKYDSGALTFPNALYDPEKGGDLFNEWLDLLEYAEQLGFDGVVYNEHHQSPHAHVPNANIITAALARRTTTLKFAPLGHVVPVHHPLQLAEEIAMLDVITRGRVIVGILKGMGHEYFTRNLNPLDSAELFREGTELMVRAWTERNPFAFDGKFFQLPCVNIWPRPLQQPHPPIWVAGGGTPATIKWAAEHRYAYVRGFDADEATSRVFQTYREFAREFGYEAEPEKIILSKPIYLAKSDDEAIKYGTQHFEYTFRQLLMGPREFWFPPGFVPPAAYPAAAAARDKSENGSMEEFNQSGRIAMGSPETIAERLLQAHRKMNYGVLIVVLGFGKMMREETKRNMEIFAQSVLPRLRQTG